MGRERSRRLFARVGRVSDRALFRRFGPAPVGASLSQAAASPSTQEHHRVAASLIGEKPYAFRVPRPLPAGPVEKRVLDGLLTSPGPSSASITADPEQVRFPRRELSLGRSFVKIQAILISAVIAFGSSCAFADPVQHRFSGVLPPAKINGIVRSMGFMPAGPPVRNGPTYAVVATSRRGMSVRVIVDARFGNVLSVAGQQSIQDALFHRPCRARSWQP